MGDKLNIYECDWLIKQIEDKAELNDGEISDEDMQTIVLAQTKSIEQLGRLVNYVKYLEGFELVAKAEVDRIQKMRKSATNRIERIKHFLRPYVEEHGPINIGTHRISTRKSEAIITEEDFCNPEYCRIETIFKPDKKKIKEDIKNGIEVEGATLETRNNVQIK